MNNTQHSFLFLKVEIYLTNVHNKGFKRQIVDIVLLTYLATMYICIIHRRNDYTLRSTKIS